MSVTSELCGIVFDMDGVIIDSHPAHRFAWKEALRQLGKQVTDRELDFVMDGRKRADILVHFLGPLSEREVQEYGALKEELFRRVASDILTIPGVHEFIECICASAIPIAVATSAGGSRARLILERLGLLKHFVAVVTGDDVREGKPDPAIYRLACQRMGCSPNTAVAVEDAASGVRAAKGAGLKCVGIAAGESESKLMSAGADCVLPNFADLTLDAFQALVGIQRSSRSSQS